MHDISIYAIRFLEREYPDRLKERYKLDAVPENVVEMFEDIGKLRGCLIAGGEVDYDKVAELVVREIRMENFGPLTFEKPSDLLEKEDGQQDQNANV
jgi:ribosome biogenesis GTPase A